MKQATVKIRVGKKQQRGKIDAGPGNFFITADRCGIRFPLPTAKHLNIVPEGTFYVHKRYDGAVLLQRSPTGNCHTKLYRNCMMIYGRLKLFYKDIKFGRYNYSETKGDIMIFNFDETWV